VDSTNDTITSINAFKHIWNERNGRLFTVFRNSKQEHKSAASQIVQMIHLKAAPGRKKGVQTYCRDSLNFYV